MAALPPTQSDAKPRSRMRRCLRLLVLSILGLILILMTLWAVAALYFDVWVPWLRLPLSVIYVLAIATGLIRIRQWIRSALFCAGGFLLVLTWWLMLAPSNDRDWQPDVAVLPYADIGAQSVTIHNIRNCDYRSETNYTVHHYERTLELAKLRSVDFYVVYWGSPWIAHTMMSFGFEGGDYVCFSIETRKEKGENYSAIKGFFRQFELTYVIGDERDLVRLRTTYRAEQVYLYRLNTDLAVVRLVFLDYLKQVNRLKDHPEWYNAVTANCTTMIRGHTKPYAKNARFDWRILLNGRIDEMAYERKSVDQSLPFEQLKARSLINERAKAADQDPAFSSRIREQLPGIADTKVRAYAPGGLYHSPPGYRMAQMP